jgi:hypothetical protein
MSPAHPGGRGVALHPRALVAWGWVVSVTLRDICDVLRRELALPKYATVFATAQARHAHLANCASIDDMLVIMGDDDPETYPIRDAITRAMLTEAHACAARFWASALIVAYYPSMSALRRRILGDPIPREELESLILEGFLKAVRTVRPDVDRIALRLSQGIRKHVFWYLRKARKIPLIFLDNEEDLGVGPEPSANEYSSCDLPRLRQRFFDLLHEHGVSPEMAAIIDATMLKGERLRAYVARTAGGDERTYQNLKRARTRALRKLRIAVPEDAA